MKNLFYHVGLEFAGTEGHLHAACYSGACLGMYPAEKTAWGVCHAHANAGSPTAPHEYRGKCKEMAQWVIEKNPALRLVRGHVHNPLSNRHEPHWWCEDQQGGIVDPSYRQFGCPQAALEYKEFNGIIACAECGKEVSEENATICGNYGFCSGRCNARFVGIYLTD